MGTLICYICQSTIAHFEDEKVTFLYSKCECKACTKADEESK
ncbi:GapA-binding peptide SR1P [Domibacillus sp. DTU_2020_1001157_1_SI_ALB_TIR_016]|nr:GapA-binding peptide SR1P [Domibacillus sp. DTU_2020_1001157_1_SI_ALB_TIR_016]WNS78802.1 GapA-binding peptide SR1P [Domibacillus sp. DTU_2020_1001157_1_SI_ALB_TIR_016]